MLRPRHDRRLGHVTARYRSRSGVIESRWRYEADGLLVWNYTVPEGAEAEVWAPGAAEGRVHGAGSYEERLTVKDDPVIVPIGGLTKAFTSALALSFASDGKLNLDALLRTYLGEGAPDVTPRQCLSCTAGLRSGH